jgi:hypothetical protein
MSEPEDKIDEAKPTPALTRRELLVTLSSAVLLSRLRGGPAQALGQMPTASASLPPGLYQPSLDHLSHALSQKAFISPIPPGTETEYVRPRSGPFAPQAFVKDEFAVVRRLVEIILGEGLRTPTEKARAGGPASIYDEVAEWIDLVVATAPTVRALARNLPADQRALAIAYYGSEEPVLRLESFEPERVCREGLAWLAEESQRRSAKKFLDLDPRMQTELVQSISDARADTSATHAGTRLFDFLKEEAVRGFYTSRLGLKELGYDRESVHGQSPGCSEAFRPQE